VGDGGLRENITVVPEFSASVGEIIVNTAVVLSENS
jgi:hypothetical protein